VFLYRLAGNRISDAGARALSEALMLNKSLTKLQDWHESAEQQI
jgi:hypothetical protein